MKILLAYDGFEHSQNALAEAAELVKDTGTLAILSVVARAHRYLRERG